MISGGRARLIAVSGVLFSVLFVVGLALTPAHAPDSASTGATIAHYVGAHRGELLLSDFLIVLSGVPFFVYMAALYRLTRQVEDDDGWVALTGLIGGVVGSAVFVVSWSLLAAVAYRPAQDPAILRALTDASWITTNLAGVSFAVFIGAISFAVLRTRVLPVWSGWVGVPVALVTLIGAPVLSAGSGAFSPQGLLDHVDGLVFAPWVLVICAAALTAVKSGGRISATDG